MLASRRNRGKVPFVQRRNCFVVVTVCMDFTLRNPYPINYLISMLFKFKERENYFRKLRKPRNLNRSDNFLADHWRRLEMIERTELSELLIGIPGLTSQIVTYNRTKSIVCHTLCTGCFFELSLATFKNLKLRQTIKIFRARNSGEHSNKIYWTLCGGISA